MRRHKTEARTLSPHGHNENMERCSQGVHGEKKDGMSSNPCTEESAIMTRDGRLFTKKNPDCMTREISA